MGNPPPISTPCFIKFLKHIGCSEAKGTKHSKWKCPGCFRPVIFDRNKKEIPYLHVQTNLRNLNRTMAGFKNWSKENC